MKFWDSSALVPLLVAEGASEAVGLLVREDPAVLVWWGSRVECVSAIACLEREAALTAGAASVAISRLDAIREAWTEVQPTERVRTTAVRLLRTHPLRGADALQLAAAIAGSEDHPDTLPFVTLDDRLAEAAGREGFVVIQPT